MSVPDTSVGWALVRSPGPRLADGNVTHIDRAPVDVGLAVQQWGAYVDVLEGAGWTVVEVPGADFCPDAVFVEDAVVIHRDLAIITRPGADSRKPEVLDVEKVVEAAGLTIARIEAPGTLDGGDVLRLGDTLYVGLSARTNEEGIRQLARFAKVKAVPVTKCLHLKSAVTDVADRTLLINSKWIDRSYFAGFELIEAEQPNALRIGDAVLYPSDIPMDELAKAEGALTCCSVIFHA